LIAGGNCQFHRFPLATPLSAFATAILSILLLLFNCFLLFVSVIIYTKEKGCCNVKGYFIKDDPFGFRIEQFGILLILIPTVLIAIMPISRYFASQSRGNTSNASPAALSALEYVEVLLFFFIELFLLISSCIVGFIYSIIAMIKEKLRTPVFDSEFEAFVNTKEGIEVFKEFSKSEWSTENILFFEDIMRFKEIKKFKAAKRQAIQMNLNFIEIGSPLEINLSGDVRRLTKKRVENFDDHKSNFQEIFDEALKETKRNMRDTFSRVTRTHRYLEWKKKAKVVIEPVTEIENNFEI
jgi:hypothetical protein